LAGVAVALALKAALVEFNISGKVSLLGTPGTCVPTLHCHSLINAIGILAEEGGAGKAILLDKGAYADMDICLMYVYSYLFFSVSLTNRELIRCHPAPGPKGSVSLSSSLALQRIEIEYSGHTYVSYDAHWLWLIYYSAHAALSPWEGKNSLDAAVLAYNNISALRQQLHPTHRVHGIIEGKDWAANSKYCELVKRLKKLIIYAVIPDYSRML